MSKREIPEINAGSMADIAFLLLIFFLVTTTMEKETGIKKNLPQKVEMKTENIIIRDRELLKVNVNLNDDLLVEGQLSEVNKLYGYAKEFFTNEENSEKYPEYFLRTKQECELQIATLEETIKNSPENSLTAVAAEKSLEDWQERLTTIKTIGEPFRQIHKMGLIMIDMDNKSSYGRYIEILSELQAAQNDLRDEYSLKYFGVKFEELNPEEDQDKILAIQTLVPQRIIKKEK